MKRAIWFVLPILFSAEAAFSAGGAAVRKQPKPPQEAPIRTMDLGDTNADLVYTPLPLCRIIDTRLGGGILGTTPREFYVAGSTNNFAAQGGAAGGCGVPTSATAVLINFVAVNPTGAGNLRGSRWPDPVPTIGSIINYQLLTPSLNIANGIPFPICDGSATTCTFDIYLRTNGAATHVVADVGGYFKRFATEELITNLVAGDGLTGGGDTGNISVAVDFAAGGTAATVSRSDHDHYAQTVLVSPQGTEAENGTALLAALAGITDASATKPYLLKIEPGIYDLGTTSLVMKQYVDIEGSGELVTILRKRPSPGTPPVLGVIDGASNTEVRLLTAEVTGGGNTEAVALSIGGTAPRVSNVTLIAATGSNNIAVRITAGGSLTMDASSLSAAGGSTAFGVLGFGGSTVNIRRSQILASGSTSLNVGVMNDAGAVAVVGSTELINTAVTASAPSGVRAEGVSSTRVNALLQSSTISATGAGDNIAVRNFTSGDSCTVRIDRSTLIGSVATIQNDANYTTRVGASKLDGGNVIPGGGTVICSGSYNENYTNAGGYGVCP